MGKNKKKFAPNGQAVYGQKGTLTTNLSKATKARLEQINKKLNDPKVQERLHKRGIQEWLEGERKLNKLENAKREARKKGQVFDILEYNRKNGIGGIKIKANTNK